ncbi:MAG: 3-dehydroquinate dehydratase [Candidatus Schekmanbacteria bacterium]|nr:3-dehydroquinate dehydratase [Candidatus Schekmanbacteria bacterium]
MRILVLHGPNLNLLGRRNVTQYGTATLKEVDDMMQRVARELGAAVECHQTSSEGEIVDMLGKAPDDFSGVVLNPGGYSHTSVAIRDAVEFVREQGLPVVEVHLSNVHARESFRRPLTAGAASGFIAGLGPTGYGLAIRAVAAIAGVDVKGNYDDLNR